MKVYVYTQKVGGHWTCRLSLDPRVDIVYAWRMRQGQEKASNLDIAEGVGDLLWFTAQPIPLGAAVYITEQWGRRPLYVGEVLRLWKEAEPEAFQFSRQEPRLDVICVDLQVGELEDHLRANPWSEGTKEALAGAFQGDLDAYALWEQLEDEAHRLAGKLFGRMLFVHEMLDLLGETELKGAGSYWRTIVQLAYLHGEVKLWSGITIRSEGQGLRPRRWRKRALYCLRCGSTQAMHYRTRCASCGSASCAYCEACLAMGRSRRCALLVHGTAAAVPAAGCARAATAATEQPQARWQLSRAQQDASRAALGFLAQPVPAAAAALRSFLLWAVTGAGKTEMIFPLIAYALERDQHVLVASPRRDVVLELAPRLAQAFPDRRIATLYGGSPDRWLAAEITLATTHQLMRFHEKFDLVIVDELDAFPYHNNESLQYAARKACTKQGKFIFLSATPPEAMQRAARNGTLPHAKVPVRYHRNPLPVPQRLRILPIRQQLIRGQLAAPLLKQLQVSVDRGAQVFVFITKINQIDKLVHLLTRHFQQITVEGTSSEDKYRAEKVIRFRKGTTRMLVSTTILERGVTIPRSDVFILDADNSLFDAASLVQMAGRAGRSKEDPAGSVFFCASEWNASQRGAVKQIKEMNDIAARHGYLIAPSLADEADCE